MSRGSRAAGKIVGLTDTVLSPEHRNMRAELRSISKHDVHAASVITRAAQTSPLLVVAIADRDGNAGELSNIDAVGVWGDWGCR
ncbi:hypothetical protein A5792_23905 [Mycolicibacterium peregrinum]|uniref:Uncharacterized protein n=1 Tax=Mycolicibacterium peregrinum TaxID=43304 RepID=A0A1A0QXI0_MYCPR|nr:hypothetical protein A5792_23905 [Mycolicibacterium peregrinum]